MDTLNKAQLVAFLATADPGATLHFYRDVLGLRLVSDDPFALVFESGGVPLRIAKVKEPVIAPYTSLGWHVTDLRASTAALRARGVKFERYPGMPQDEFGIMQFPGGSAVAWFKDPNGYTLSLSQ